MRNNVEKIVEQTIKKHRLIENGDTIILGLSGGPDSTCLFHLLLALAKNMDLTIVPVHVNHQMRPGYAERDQHHVEELCKINGLTCRTFTVDCLEMARRLGLTSEEAGRKARYDSFYQVAMEQSVDPACRDCENVKIAVAQNANDQAETVLFRILRGTGTDGLAGIAYQRYEIREGKSFSVIRPLLDVFRKDIETYCEEKGLDPVVDHTNQEAIYTRNKIRLELLPELERRFNENMQESLVRLSRIARADKEFIWDQVENSYQRVCLVEEEKQVILDRQGLAELHDAIRHRIVFKAFAKIGLECDITEERLSAADQIICRKQGPRKVEFPHHYELCVAKGKVVFQRSESNRL